MPVPTYPGFDPSTNTYEMCWEDQTGSSDPWIPEHGGECIHTINLLRKKCRTDPKYHRLCKVINKCRGYRGPLHAGGDPSARCRQAINMEQKRVRSTEKVEKLT